jgi:argininosuccinate lyase
MSEHPSLISLFTAPSASGASLEGPSRILSVEAAAWSIIATHVMELRTAEVIDDAAMASVALALQASPASTSSSDLPARQVVSDLVQRTEQRVPAATAGVLTLGLSAEELLATVGRIHWRQLLLAVMGASLGLSLALQRLAETHIVTIMPAHLGGQPVQPTTLAHYLGGVIDPLASARRRLREAYAVVNRSPLGAGLLTGDVVGSDRGELATRLGFADPIPNTLVALGEVGDLVEGLDAVAAVVAAGDRFVREVQMWVRTDPTSFVLDEPWLQSPEDAHPSLSLGYRLDRLQFRLGSTIDRIDGMRSQLRRFAYGPVGAGHDVIVRMAGEIGEVMVPLLTELTGLITSGIVVNRAYLGNRAGRFYTTAPDLATFLMTEENLPPTMARQIAVLVLARLKDMRLEVSGITPDMIDSAALMTIGRELKVEMETLGRFLAPRRYIERRQVMGAARPGHGACLARANCYGYCAGWGLAGA